ncbi:MAG: SprT-like domain-containing protein [Candidatus Acidiferrales bacterium]
MRTREQRARLVPGGERLFQRMYTRLGCQGRPPHFVVEYHPYTDLTHTIRVREDTARVRLSDVLRGAPQAVFEAAASILLGRLYRRRLPAELLETYRQFSYAPATRRKLLLLRQQRARRAEHQPAGAHHDLSPLFDRLNRHYFLNSLPQPRMGWSTRAWRTQLGCFDPALQQIVINRQLDRSGVPEYVVAYVLYHEMLHLKHPMRFARCRRESHSPKFRKEEKRFADYERAMKFLDRFPAY